MFLLILIDYRRVQLITGIAVTKSSNVELSVQCPLWMTEQLAILEPQHLSINELYSIQNLRLVDLEEI